MGSNVKKAAYGDFQTPEVLARDVCVVLKKQGLRPAALLEPTCGVGNFLLAGLDRFPEVQQALGADINAEYIGKLQRAIRQRPDAGKVRIVQADFFAADWEKVISDLPEPVLVLGN